MPDSEITYADHYRQIEKSGGYVPELHVDIPGRFRHVWNWFLELTTSRGEGGLPYSEIQAWQRLTGRSLSIHEVKLIKMIDRRYLEVFNG